MRVGCIAAVDLDHEWLAVRRQRVQHPCPPWLVLGELQVVDLDAQLAEAAPYLAQIGVARGRADRDERDASGCQPDPQGPDHVRSATAADAPRRQALQRDQGQSQEQILVEEEEGQNRLKALRNALSVLNPRERRIFEARRLSDDPITLEDLSTEFGVSRERVRQIEVRAFEKIQEAVRKNLAQIETTSEAAV